MIAGKRVLGLIPARGGSKRLPRKNLLPLAGKPLIAWTIEAAHRSKYLDRVVLSSEDEEIISVAAQYGCDVPFQRPTHLAQDDTPGIEPVLHALDEIPGYDYLILLQPTSPLRLQQDIDDAIEVCVRSGSSSSVSVTEVSLTDGRFYRLHERHLRPVQQDRSVGDGGEHLSLLQLNGAVYVGLVNVLRNTRTFVNTDCVPYFMPKDRSIDIDTRADLLLSEYLISLRNEVAYDKA